MFRNFYCLLLVALLLSSCMDSKLRVKKTNFDEEVQRAQNLVFTLNRNAIGDTALLNKWDTTQYIRFEPAIPGRFMWTGRDELTFSPSSLLAPATNYKGIPTVLLSSHTSEKRAVSSEPVIFHTPGLAIASIRAYWALSEDPGRQLEVRLQLAFNNPVSPSKLKPLMKITTEGKELPITLLSQADGETLELSLQYSINDPEHVAECSLRIMKGMASSGGNMLTENDLKESFSIPSMDELEIMEVLTGFDKGQGVISVYTSQPVMPDGLENLISIDPAIPFTTELVSNGFTLKGDFRENTSYSLRISARLKNAFGRELGEDYIQPVEFGTLTPFIGFQEKNAAYLSAKGFRNLAVQIINVPKVKVSVFKIFENNIQHYLRQGKTWDYYYDEDEYYDFYGYSFDDNYGKPVMSREVATRSLPRAGNVSLLNLDLEQLRYSDPYKGIYLVKVESADRRWLQDVQMVSLSDLGMIVKQGADDIMVFVNSLKDALPVKGARVDFISTNNQKLTSVVTDQNGVAVFRKIKQSAAGFQPGMIAARYDQDFNFLIYKDSKVETSRFDIGGKRTENLDYDVFLYGERDLYRPGDSVHLNTIVRTNRWERVADIPVKLKVMAPGGKEFVSQRKMLNANGAATAAFYIPVRAMTGSYLAEIYSANNVLLAGRRFTVEEFVPDRIKVTVKTDKNLYLPGQKMEVLIHAENLYGTPAAGRKAETELRLVRKNFRPSAFSDYNFSINLKDFPILTPVLQQTTTGAGGEAGQTIMIPPFQNIGLLEGSVFTTVFDETGRPVNRLSKVSIPTQQVYLGIRHMDEWVGTRRQLNLKFAATDLNGKAVNATARISISHFRYETVIERGYSQYNYVSQKKETVVLSKDIKLNAGLADLGFTPSRSGEYEVRIMLPGSENYVSATFYAYGGGDTDYNSFEVNREGEISISTDKPSYRPGEKAKLLFKTPFDGTMLVAFEQNNVLDYKFISVKNKSASLELPLSAAHLPNVFVDATLFRKSVDQTMPLTVAHGITSLKVDDPDRKIKVSISAPAATRSSVKQTLKIQSIPNSEVTVAVVDEGILQVTGYRTPDPYDWFYQKRALGVLSYDVYGQLYPEIRAGSSTAGGEAFDLSRRINPLTHSRVKLISLWSGILKTNSSGTCSFTIDIPQFSGALRVMAVAYKDNRFGAAEQLIKVADPVVISTSFPRFLSPGDIADFNVNLTNTTAKGTEVQVGISCTGPLSVSSRKSETFLKAGAESHLSFSATAGATTGNAILKVSVKASGQNFIQEITVPVRPPSGLVYVTGSGVVKAGKSTSLKIQGDLLPSGSSSKLFFSRSPVTQFYSHLASLIRYPYGCIEQTISTAMPQIYLKDAMALLAKAEAKTAVYANTDYNVQQAVHKVEASQLYNGGFPMWSEGGEAQWWVSAYAVHFLLEAEKAGYEVEGRIRDGGLRFLEQKVKERQTQTWFYSENNTSRSRVIPSPEIFYSLYVLALADKPSIPVMNFYKTQLKNLSPESRYLLATSFMLAGDRKTFQAILPKNFSGEKAEPVGNGYLGSFTRDLALVLNSLLEADPMNPQIGVLLQELTEEAGHASRYYTTQEQAFTLLAVGKQARRAAGSDISATITLDGKIAGNFHNNDLLIREPVLNRDLSVTTTGNGLLYYSYEMSGIARKLNTSSEDNAMKVRKRFYDRNGKELTSNTFSINDLIVVELTVEAMAGKTIDNVAVTDLLPACFEIENSRLVAEREMSWMKKRSSYEYMDVRDDRISFFGSAGTAPSVYYYTVRAVNKGVYTMGPVTADAMYNGRYHSLAGGRVVTVR